MIHMKNHYLLTFFFTLQQRSTHMMAFLLLKARLPLVLMLTMISKERSEAADIFVPNFHDNASVAAALLDDPKLTFHGIGGLSGGGATTRFLIDYPEPQRSEILDILFRPNFAASLHILKVEIGGDSQSTDGTESSHMHSADDLDCTRGYEWWLLREARARNPDIITYGLPWAFPGWVNGNSTNDHQNPFAKPELTVEYIAAWLKCARDVHHVDIDFIGLWNECGRPDMGENEYAKLLRKTLNDEGFTNTKIVAKDNHADVCDELAEDAEYRNSIYAVGLHYPPDYPKGIYEKCHALNKPFWSSEESSSYADNNGAACWARVIASHFVLSGITSNIMWNLVAAYMHGTNWYNSALFRADQPWSGNYDRGDDAPVVWATAHYTQFISPGWRYLSVNSKGSGELPSGGFYTSLVSPDKKDFTFVSVKISRDHAECTRPRLPNFDVKSERIKLHLPGPVADKTLHVWKSNFEIDGAGYFQYLGTADVSADGIFVLYVDVGDIITVSTISTAQKGTFKTALPASDPKFPLPYSDTFDDYQVSQEARYFSDQIGAWEIHSELSADGDLSSENHVMRQMVPSLPVGWMGGGTNARGPLSIVGMMELNDINISAKFRLPSSSPTHLLSACIGARVDMYFKQGIVLCVAAQGNWTLSYGGPFNGGAYPSKAIIASGEISTTIGLGSWHNINLVVSYKQASGSLDGSLLFVGMAVRDTASGFAAIGTNMWQPVEFDDFQLSLAVTATSPGQALSSFQVGQLLGTTACARNGVADPRQGFSAKFNWKLYHTASGLCAEAGSTSEASSVQLATCIEGEPKQEFRHRYTNIRNWPVEITLGSYKALRNTLKLVGYNSGIVKVIPGKDDENWNLWVLFPNTGQLRNTYNDNITLGYPACLTVLDGGVSTGVGIEAS